MYVVLVLSEYIEVILMLETANSTTSKYILYINMYAI